MHQTLKQSRPWLIAVAIALMIATAVALYAHRGARPANRAVSRLDPALYYAPGVWDDDGQHRIANSNGSYVKFDFTGTSLAMRTAALGKEIGYPTFSAYIDDAAPVVLTAEQGATTFSFAQQLTRGRHHAFIVLRNMPGNGRWDRSSALLLQGFDVDMDGKVLPPSGPITVRPKSMLFFGDSITEGERSISQAPPPAGGSAMLSVVPIIAKALDAEYGQLGYGMAGFAVDANALAGNVPRFNKAYRLYSAGRSRMAGTRFAAQTDYVLCYHGANGTTTLTAVDVAKGISNMRAGAPSAWIFMLVPQGGWSRSVITSATNTAIAAGDKKLALIDLGARFEYGMNGAPAGTFATGALNNVSADHIHPLARTNADAAAEQVRLMQAWLLQH